MSTSLPDSIQTDIPVKYTPSQAIYLVDRYRSYVTDGDRVNNVHNGKTRKSAKDMTNEQLKAELMERMLIDIEIIPEKIGGY